MQTALREAADIRADIAALVDAITPFDTLEAQHITDARAWIASGAPIFRIQKPDVPPQHLVSYIVVFDEAAQKLLLVDHKKALLWLPAGGHVEPDEHPAVTVIRECAEELGIAANFWQPLPLFLTITPTVGLTAGHTDVSFWYVVNGSHTDSYDFDAGEFNGIGWFGLDEIPTNADPHLQRFAAKLKAQI